MTRINVVLVNELSDNFIMAEFFELPRIYPLAVKAAQRDDRDIPEHYVMGEGHMRFFYNKLSYLVARQAKLRAEGLRRGLKLIVDPKANVPSMFILRSLNSFWWQDYVPTAEAIQLNRNRLAYRHRTIGGAYT